MPVTRTATQKKRSSKVERLEARISREQKELFQRAAELTGHSLTDFVVSTVQEAATRAIRESEQMDLSQRDRELFVDTLLNAPTPGKQLRQAARRYKDRMKH